MIDAGVIRVFVDFVKREHHRLSSATKEGMASAMWYLCRDDKVTARKELGLRLMCAYLSDESPAVVEHAAGALSSLTITVQENRDAVREEGGFQKLLELLVAHRATANGGKETQQHPSSVVPGQPVSFSYALMNILLSVRNATSANEANLKMASAFPGLLSALVSIIQNGSEDYAKEAALCVKNLSLDRGAVEEMSALGVGNALTRLAEKGTTDPVRKAAAMALQSVTRYGVGPLRR
jgi:hypothetical protein